VGPEGRILSPRKGLAVAKNKRGNGEGSISRRKGGGWMAQYTIYTAEGPKRKTLYGKTRAEVAAKLARALSDREVGVSFDAQNQTVGEYLNRWLRDSVKDTVRQGTFERHEQILRLHVWPGLGGLKLKALTPAHVQGFYRDRLDAGLSPATVRKIHVVLHKALDQAVEWSLVPRNATEAVKAPKPNPEEIRPLDKEQAKALLEVAHGERLEALYVLAVHTGLRQGELLGLRWEDVDLKNGLVRVKRTLTRRKGRLLLGEPKTKRSRRTVRLTESAVEALIEHLARQMEQMERLGDLYEGQGLVFATQRSTLVNPTNLRKRSFAPLLERAGLPAIRFHDLRHTCATLLLSRNVNPKIVSEMLGHASIAITLDTYSHVLPDMQDSAVRALEDALR
jgi:integrase